MNKNRYVRLAILFIAVVAIFAGYFLVKGNIPPGDCSFPSARSFTVYFDWKDNSTRLRIVDTQTNREESSSKVQATIYKEASQRIKDIASQTGWNKPEGHISISVGGCSEPYLISWSNPELPRVSRLMAAAELWNLEDLRAVLATGIDVNVRDFQGHTALMYAAVDPTKELHKHPEQLEKMTFRPSISAVQFLLQQGANPNARDLFGITPLDLAGYDTAALLLAAGAEVNARDDQGRAPLMIAAQKGDARLTKIFLGSGATVDEQDNEGNSALMYAVNAKSFQVTELLRAAGANPRALNRAGKSALSQAREHAQRDPDFRKIISILNR